MSLSRHKVAFTAERVCSILTDFGTEKEAWFMPGLDGGDISNQNAANLLFKFSMPLPDADHSLHHATGRVNFESCNGL